MQTFLNARRSGKSFSSKPLLMLTSLLTFAHILVVTVMPHPVLASNILQLLFPALVTGVSLQQRKLSVTSLGRRCWTALAIAFGIWSAAQGLYIYFLFRPVHMWGPLRPDDALWLLFGLPLLLAVNLTHEKVDRAGRLDRAQAVLFCVVLYFMVFSRFGRLSLFTAYLIQNAASMLCCLLRLPLCRLAREYRFFVRLFIFLFLYGVLETVGDQLYLHGWKIGSFVDLTWTLPVAIFLILTLRDDLRSDSGEGEQFGRWNKAVDSAQGLSIAALTFLSMGASALLATRRPLVGGLFVVLAFGIFAFRTTVRERAWHEAHGKLEETSLQDALTGLGNRTLLRTSLQHRLLHPQPKLGTVLIFADLDRFKTINDSVGHALGDQLLIQIAARLRAAASADSVICRHGGDEFVVLTTAASPDQAFAAGEALLRALRPQYQLGPHTLSCTASIGVVLALPGESAEDLLRTADHAMYRAKQLGKNCVQMFDAALRAHMSSRWQLEADLRATLEQGGIDVAFQPILSVEGGHISGFEALARWTHPLHGSIPPSEFIPLAEESGLILQLGAQVLENACLRVASWNHSWQTSFSLSVNVSPRQFTDGSLVSRILDVLDRTGFPASLLRLELTESALLVNEDRVKETLDQICAHGIRISLDDFGTGYSSLAFLLSLPVDEVKVDRSFVSDMHLDPQRRELVRTVVQLGQSLGKRVVAEGVETEQELRELAAMGCECAQGWLISRPLAAEALEADMPSIQARNAQTAQDMQRGIEFPEPVYPMQSWTEVLDSRAAAVELTS